MYFLMYSSRHSHAEVMNLLTINGFFSLALHRALLLYVCGTIFAVQITILTGGDLWLFDHISRFQFLDFSLI
jgi:hypothetical protein